MDFKDIIDGLLIAFIAFPSTFLGVVIGYRLLVSLISRFVI